ncbi:uncharacterized protein LOC144753982 [Lissotriton helveticus]
MAEVTNSSEKFSGRVFRPEHSFFTSQQKADVKIHDVQHNDAGTYVCEVELFMINSQGRGNGTQLLVLDAPRNQESGAIFNPIILYTGLGLACLLLLAVVLIAYIRKRKGGEDHLLMLWFMRKSPGKERKARMVKPQTHCRMSSTTACTTQR